MNKLFIILVLMMIWFPRMSSQNHPQFEFYSNYDISSLTGGVSNCVDEAQCIEYTFKLYDVLKKDSINDGDAFKASLYAGLICHNNKGNLRSEDELEAILIKVASLNDKQRIDLLKRLYDIENSCYIKYSTVDGEKINFLVDGMDSEYGAIPVDFGSSLISNQELNDNEYVLKFANPISQVDAKLFSKNIKSIKLPKKSKLNYLDNESKDVSGLTEIDGSDVISGNTLVNMDGTLVATATLGLREFQVPDGVVCLGKDCFRNSSIESIVIPASVGSIRSGAFNGCDNLKVVRFNGDSIIDLDDAAFDLDKSNTWRIIVAKNLVKQYKKKNPLLKKRFSGF